MIDRIFRVQAESLLVLKVVCIRSALNNARVCINLSHKYLCMRQSMYISKYVHVCFLHILVLIIYTFTHANNNLCSALMQAYNA